MSTRALRTRVGGAALAASLALGAVACSSDDDPASTAAPEPTGPSASAPVEPSAPAGKDGEPARSAGDVLSRVEAATARQGTVVATYAVDASGRTTVTRMAVRTGDDPAFRATVEVPGQPPTQLRLVDGVMYLRGPAIAGDSWVRADVDDRPAVLAGIDHVVDSARAPTGELAALRAAGELRVVGTERVDGVRTTHYRATVDASDALDALPGGLREQYAKAVEAGLDSYTVDVWVGADDLPRRIRVDLDLEDGPVRTRVELSRWGAGVDVQAPPRRDTVGVDELPGV